MNALTKREVVALEMFRTLFMEESKDARRWDKHCNALRYFNAFEMADKFIEASRVEDVRVAKNQIMSSSEAKLQ